MSSHHVIYACHCLNVKIQLAKKYYLDKHEQYRQSKFTRTHDPTLSGWLFELNTEGIVIEYPSLVRIRRIKDNSAGWITVNCHNCSTGDVYSVKRPYARASTNLIDEATRNQFGEHILIHQGVIFGKQIDAVQKKGIYSSIFRIVVNPDLPIDHISLEKEDEIDDPELQRQQKQIQERLEQSFIDLEEKTKQKIQDFQKEQETLMHQKKEKALYDGAILWQTMKEVSKTIHVQEQRVQRLSSPLKVSADQAIVDRVKEVEQQNDSQDSLEMTQRESHIHFPHESAFRDVCPLQRRRSCAFKRDLFGGLAYTTIPSINDRKSSYVLDENAISNSCKPHQSMTQVNRKRSSLVSSNVINNLHPFVKHSNNCNKEPSNNFSTWKNTKEENDCNKSEKADDEDLFPLDEDAEGLFKYTCGSDQQDSRLKNNESSSKCNQFEDKEKYSPLERPEKDKKEPMNFATSVPITIAKSPGFASKKEIHHTMQKRSSCSSFIEPAYLVNKTSKEPLFVGTDYTETDRRASAIFQSLNQERKRHSTRLPSPEYLELHHNDLTRRLSSSKNKIQLELEQDQDVDHGPMIPPHIFAATRISGETETLFGSIPHSRIRARPVE